MIPRSEDDRIGPALLRGALVVALLEAIFVLAFSAPSFDGMGERLTFVSLELGLGLIVGCVAAALAEGFVAMTGPARRSRVLAVVSTPAVAYVAWALLRGPKVRALPGHDALVVAVTLAGVAGIYLAARIVARVATAQGSARGLAIAVLFLGAAALHLSDEWTLPRLYPAFHRALELVTLGVAALACGLSTRGRRLSPLVLVLLALVAAGGVRVGLRHAPGIATILVDTAPAGGALGRVLLRGEQARPMVKLAGDEAPLPPRPAIGARDVVLVTIDATRADRLTPRVMPNVSRLASAGVRFDEAYTQVPHTSFAVATLLTGKYVYSLSALGLDAASHETLAQVMRRERYKTAAFFPPAVFFIDHDRLKPVEDSKYGFEYVKYEYLDAKKRTDQVIDFFEVEHPAHAFVWVHYLEPHEPYDVHEGFTEGTPGAPPPTPGLSDAQRRYEGEIRYVDHEVERLVEFLQKARPGALVIVAADHGEEFGEHGGRYHGTTLFDEQVRVPLVFGVVGPADGHDLPARVVPGAVGLVDVAPTVLSLLGIPSSARMRGRDLSGFMARAPATPHARPVFAEIDRKKMIVSGALKLSCDLEIGTCALYDRATDPGEKRDVSAQRPDDAAKLRARLDAFMNDEQRFEQKEALPPEVEKLLSRGRLGDATVAPELLAALPTLQPGPRHEALQLLSTLPAVPGARPKLDALGSDDALLVALITARGGDPDAKKALLAGLSAQLPDDLYARAALATGDVTKMADAIDRIDDRVLVVSLADALASTHDPRALDALLIALAPVRSRAAVTTAIGALGDPRAIPWLVRWLPNDPYVMVRAAMVRTLAQLARTPEDKSTVRAALTSLAETEQEAPVLRALVAALGPGKHGAVEIGPSVPARGRQRLLLLPEGATPESATIALPIVDGVATLPASWNRVVPGATTLARPTPRSP